MTRRIVRPAPTPRAIRTAKTLRRRLTPEEAHLWTELRRMPVLGTHFRKQIPIGPYVVDFACLSHRLIVEVDGEQHGFDDQRRHDMRRTDFLEAEGYRVIRFWNADIRREIGAVLDTVHAALHGSHWSEPMPARTP